MRRTGAPALLIVAFGASAGAQTPPSAADLLFEAPQWQAAEPGARLTYRYTRSGRPDLVPGPTVEDRITITLEASASAQSRTARINMFSQTRHRAAGPFEDVTGNPVLVLFLEHHVENLARILNGNPRYLKNAIRAGLRDKARVAPATVEISGAFVPGWRVDTTPFAADPNKHRMHGLEGLTYTFVTADRVPGAIRSIKATSLAEDGSPLFSESLTYEPNAQ
jgi:hypothetical protein